ncbi:MAG: ribonuclease HI family protein [Candidatus Omnitrophota bacterium]
MKNKIQAWFDGCCEPRNPGGHAGYGAVIMEGSIRLTEITGYIPAAPTTSNNVGEYQAFISILEWLKENGMVGRRIHIRGDSKLIIEQMFGRWRIKNGLYVPFALKAKKLLAEFKRLTGEWIPREENSIADDLSKRELIKRGVEFKIQPLERLGCERKITA